MNDKNQAYLAKASLLLRKMEQEKSHGYITIKIEDGNITCVKDGRTHKIQ